MTDPAGDIKHIEDGQLLPARGCYPRKWLLLLLLLLL